MSSLIQINANNAKNLNQNNNTLRSPNPGEILPSSLFPNLSQPEINILSHFFDSFTRFSSDSLSELSKECLATNKSCVENPDLTVKIFNNKTLLAPLNCLSSIYQLLNALDSSPTVDARLFFRNTTILPDEAMDLKTKVLSFFANNNLVFNDKNNTFNTPLLNFNNFFKNDMLSSKACTDIDGNLTSVSLSLPACNAGMSPVTSLDILNSSTKESNLPTLLSKDIKIKDLYLTTTDLFFKASNTLYNIFEYLFDKNYFNFDLKNFLTKLPSVSTFTTNYSNSLNFITNSNKIKSNNAKTSNLFNKLPEQISSISNIYELKENVNLGDLGLMKLTPNFLDLDTIEKSVNNFRVLTELFTFSTLQKLEDLDSFPSISSFAKQMQKQLNNANGVIPIIEPENYPSAILLSAFPPKGQAFYPGQETEYKQLLHKDTDTGYEYYFSADTGLIYRSN